MKLLHFQVFFLFLSTSLKLSLGIPTTTRPGPAPKLILAPPPNSSIPYMAGFCTSTVSFRLAVISSGHQ